MSIKMQMDVSNLLIAVSELAKRVALLEQLVKECRQESAPVTIPSRPEIKLKNGKAYI